MNKLNLNLKDTFTSQLPGDPNKNNTRRQVEKACYSYATPRQPSQPRLVCYSQEMAGLLGLTPSQTQSPLFVNIFSGKEVINGTTPYAMCYGGHQFGQWAGQLGDGRAINLAEVEHKGKAWALQLKGAGETPYSRTADGLAVLRSSIREFLCSEAMFHLGVPTTRALSLMLTGDEVLRDVMYDGHPAYEKGAVVCRVAPSFLRFGNFEILAARQDKETLKTLVDYTLTNFYPELGLPCKKAYVALFAAVADRTIDMVLAWQRVGFVHGVMNTDNLSILGLTIDYGPYGWLEGYDHDWTPNTTDRQMKRYRFGNQPNISLWNLSKLASALYPLIEDADELNALLENYKTEYSNREAAIFRQKLGLTEALPEDEALVLELKKVLHLTETDMTIFFRSLALIPMSESSLHAMPSTLEEAFYRPGELVGNILEHWLSWLNKYRERLKKDSLSQEDRAVLMGRVNPKYVLRNYMAQLAIEKADEGDFSIIEELLTLIKNPYDEQPDMVKWFAKRPEWARTKVGCSMLSCSS